jgi:hypothetical protein
MDGGVRWRRSSPVLWRRTLDAVVVLRADDREADPTTISGGGAGVWELLTFAPTTDELVAELADRFQADAEVVADDVVRLLAELADRGLVERVA